MSRVAAVLLLRVRHASAYFAVVGACLAPNRAAAQSTSPPAVPPPSVCAPTLEATVARAIETAGLSADVDDRWARQARRAALVPATIRLRLGRRASDVFRLETRLDQDFDGELLADGTDLSDVQRAGDDHVQTIEVAAEWRLSGAVWGPEQIAIARAVADRAEQRVELADDVTTVYAAWCGIVTAQALSVAPAAMDATAEPTRGPAEVSTLARLAALLDVYTDGWFARAVASEGRSSP
ncbi:MAG: hypothetical protein H6700_08690 [Myxococcales bacterium]|nr:hypothetical protein [Myxococcales bacterium]MCB9520101.1 hypothetical protein [Myxococcales bacterium]MCB9531827.1 hypothetical protein [Myxococcales bacterium]